MRAATLERPEYATTGPETYAVKGVDRVSGRLPQGLDLELIVPAYNEEMRIAPTLLALSDHLSTMPVSAGIRIIDNGSSDRTAEIVDMLGGGRVPIAVSGCSQRGKGAAVSRGMVTSTARWVGFCDADLATAPSAIDDAVELLAAGWEVVVGSRRGAKSLIATRQPLVRRVGGTAFRRISRRYIGDITDTQCGFKFFEGEAARRLFSDMTLTGFAFDLEIIAKARAMGFAMVELGVEWNDREGSTFSPVRDGVKVAQELWRLHRTMTKN
jgi:glycosyltransferase involved in cell wall biosynthesis